jgi:3-methyladenine DNA glycosylase AlkD
MVASQGRRRPLGQAVTAARARRLLRAAANPSTAVGLQRFFKTGPGQYAEGDRFLGVMVPQTRAVARQCARLSRRDVVALLRSPYHEERLLALIVLTRQFQRGTEAGRRSLFRLYVDHRMGVNNWDLVDASAPYIVGPHLERRSRALLDRLAGSRRLWDRRIAVLATLHFIRNGEYGPTLSLCERLLTDREDLIHKACGWMLREVGRRDRRGLERFLRRHATVMPRTMLRYAIEHWPPSVRRRYMARPANR